MPDILADAVRQLDSLRARRVRQENGDLLTPVARDVIGRSKLPPEPLGERAEAGVASRMTELVVDLLEVIDIDEEKREWD